MKMIDACEAAYKNGYEKGRKEAINAKTFKNALRKMLKKNEYSGLDEFEKLINRLKCGKDPTGRRLPGAQRQRRELEALREYLLSLTEEELDMLPMIDFMAHINSGELYKDIILFMIQIGGE